MLGNNGKSIDIRLAILSHIKSKNNDFVKDIAKSFDMSIQAVYKHVRWLESEGFVGSKGRTKGKEYSLGENREQLKFYSLFGLEESDAYQSDFSHVFEGLEQNVDEICLYGFTEMLNNAIDHSDGDKVTVHASKIGGKIEIVIDDDGEGIFKRISRILKLASNQESLLELSKGKLTTDPKRHSGEGIFFTSRVFDTFAIFSRDLFFTHHDNLPDRLDEREHSSDGTQIHMWIDESSPRDLGDVFDQFSSGPDEYSFETTIIPVKLAKLEGEKLVSRSQAKRLLRRVEKFKNVILDFEGIGFIGQAFADEVFRVYAQKHPEISISVENLNERGLKMMKRAQSHKS